MAKSFCAEVRPRGCVVGHSVAVHSCDVWNTLAWLITRNTSCVNGSCMESISWKAIRARGVHFWAVVRVMAWIGRCLIAETRRVEIIHIDIGTQRSDFLFRFVGGSSLNKPPFVQICQHGDRYTLRFEVALFEVCNQYLQNVYQNAAFYSRKIAMRHIFGTNV